MSPESKQAKLAKNSYKDLKDSPSGKQLKQEILSAILSYSHKMPDWGSLNIKVL
jgi:hypothetical protein